MGLAFWPFVAIVTIIGVLLFAQALWKIELEETPSPDITVGSFVSGLILGELALALSFWPLNPEIGRASCRERV